MCLYPLSLSVASTTFGKDILVFAPCGKCIECVVERQNSYKLRLCYEARRWKHCFFFTLTYRTSSLPLTVDTDTGEQVSTCCKLHVRAWLKVMRERFLREYGHRFDFRYFICSEYGSTDNYVDDRGIVRKATGRPHYHGIIFCNECPEFLNQMFDEWRKLFGRVDCKELKPTQKCPDIREHRSKVANYVAKYCCKGEFSSRVDEIDRGVIEPSWFILSNGIGSNYVDDMKDYHLVQDGIFSNPALSYLPTGAFTIDMVDCWFRSRKGTSRQKHAEMVWDYLNEVVDRMRVQDGACTYRMPRYYRQKIYGTSKRVKRFRTTKGFALRFCFEQVTYSPIHGEFVQAPRPFLRTCEEVEVKVPTSENFLSCGVAYVLRHRSDITSAQEYQQFVVQHLGKDSHKIHWEFGKYREAQRIRRENSKRSKLRSFYQKNHLDHPELSA